jgi:YggT family protein
MFGLSYMLLTLARLLDIVLNIYFWVVIVAVIVSWLPLDPHHPTARTILHYLRRVTEPVFNFFRRTFRLHRYTAPLDFTPLVVILAIFFLRIFLVQTINDIAIIGNSFQLAQYVVANFLLAVLYTLYLVLNIYFWIVIIAVILSWIPLDPYHPIARAILLFLRTVTEPVFNFFRRTFRLHRYISPLDFTPMIVIFVIYLLQNVLIRYLIQSLMTLRRY